MTITPVDEFNPAFAGGLDVTENIAENAAAVVLATNYAATDADDYPGELMSYTLGGADAALFTLTDNGNSTFNL